MAAEDDPDLTGALLERVRTAVGPNVPIVGTFDLHANITRRMLSNADVLSGYHTSPHLDSWQTGERAARALWTILKKGIHPQTVWRKLPMFWQVQLVGWGQNVAAGQRIRTVPARYKDWYPAEVQHKRPASPAKASLSTALIHDPYQPPPGFAAPQPGVHKASTVIFRNTAAMDACSGSGKLASGGPTAGLSSARS